jgi:hypothetical protein
MSISNTKWQRNKGSKASKVEPLSYPYSSFDPLILCVEKFSLFSHGHIREPA